MQRLADVGGDDTASALAREASCVFMDPLSTTLRALPAVDDRATLLILPLPEPFVSRCLTALASRAVKIARHGHRDRLTFAVCGVCTCCDTYAQTVRIAAQTAGIDTTLFLPASATPAGSGPTPASTHSDTLAWSGAGQAVVDGSYADAVAASKQYAARVGAAEATPPGPAGNHGHFGVATALTEIFGCLPGPPAQLWTPRGELCVGVDTALRLLGWPTAVTAVAAPATGIQPATTSDRTQRGSTGGFPAVPDTAVVFPDVAVPAGADLPRGPRRVMYADPGLVGRAQEHLAAAGVTATARAALGLAGLLQHDPTRDRDRPTDLEQNGAQVVLVAASSAPGTGEIPVITPDQTRPISAGTSATPRQARPA